MMRLVKKGQAALEFLTTYGWAFMVLIVVISSLAYFGIVSPDIFIPDRCVFEGGITCKDYAAVVDDQQVKAQLVNSVGSTLEIMAVYMDCNGVVCSPCVAGAAGDGKYWCNLTFPTSTSPDPFWRAGDVRELLIDIDPAPSNRLRASSRPKIDVTITYKRVSEYFNKNLTGVISVKPS